jgi:hypothetical protein
VDTKSVEKKTDINGGTGTIPLVKDEQVVLDGAASCDIALIYVKLPKLSQCITS